MKLYGNHFVSNGVIEFRKGMCTIKKLCLIHLILPLFLLISCSETTIKEQIKEGKIPSQISSEFTHKGQTFHIIPLYEEVLAYTAKAIDNPPVNTKNHYFEEVLEPFQNKLDENNADAGSYYFDYFFPTKDVKKLEENTADLLRKQQKINETVKASLIKSSDQIAGGDTIIFLLPGNPEMTVIPDDMEGVSGVTFSDEVILLQIDPSFTEKALKYTTAHEYHHTINMGLNGMKMEPLAGLSLNEGKADSFAKIVYPDYKAEWTVPLPEDSEEIVLAEFKKNLDSYDLSVYYEFFGGNPSKGLPHWSNYKIGFSILQDYLESHPEDSIEEWTRLGWKDILQGSEFKHLLN
jgi:uncharacterized protein YjaZ